jgi:hypothetical protein
LLIGVSVPGALLAFLFPGQTTFFRDSMNGFVNAEEGCSSTLSFLYGFISAVEAETNVQGLPPLSSRVMQLLVLWDKPPINIGSGHLKNIKFLLFCTTVYNAIYEFVSSGVNNQCFDIQSEGYHTVQ